MIARPISDISDGLWQPTPIFSRIYDLAPEDANKVTSSAECADAFEVKLSPLVVVPLGTEIVSVRLRQDAPAPVAVQLLQGTNVIASWTVQPTTTFTTFNFSLTSDQIAQISDYTDLRLRVVACLCSSSSSSPSGSSASGSSASGSSASATPIIPVPCCNNSFPPTLKLTVTASNNNCPNIVGTYTLNYVPSITCGVVTYQPYNNTHMWATCFGTGAGVWMFTCDDQSKKGCLGFAFQYQCGLGVIGPLSPTSCTCDPINFVFTKAEGPDVYCCSGLATLTFTITS